MKKALSTVLCLVLTLTCAFNIAACGSSHTHAWSQDWQKDDAHHWHECTAGCGEKKDYAEHDFSNGDCVCGKTQTPSQTHTHVWSQGWKSDGTHHWHECTDAGCSEKKDYAEHDFTSGDCVCGKKKPHAWSKDWQYDGTHHWRECTDAGCSEKKDYGEHDFADGDSCLTCNFKITETKGFAFTAVSGGYSVTGYNGDSKIVIIPEQYEGQAVVSIGESAFEEVNADYVKIPDSVKEIGQYAFYGCTAKKISFGNGLERIGFCVFGECANLTDVALPQSVTSLGNYSFWMSGLENAVINANITALPDYTFNGCESLVSVTLSKSILSVGRSAFDGCVNLESLQASAFTSVGHFAFYNAGKLDIDVSSVTSMGESAFRYSGITNAVIAAASVENYAFLGCERLKAVTVGEACKSIGIEAFYGCPLLESVNIGSGLNKIDGNSNNRGFIFGCYALKTVTVSDSNQTFKSVNNAILSKDGATLYWGNSDGEIPAEVKTIGSNAFGSCKAKTISIPDTVTKISDYAFRGCLAESVHIGKGVISLGLGIFRDCSKLAAITVSSENTYVKAKGNCLIITQNGKVTVRAGCKTSVIPTDENIALIDQYAFCGIDELTEISIPESVTDIGDRAFKDCFSLEKLTLRDGLKTIGAFAFDGCAIKNLQIPRTLTSIFITSFYNCPLIESIACDENNTKYVSSGNCLIDKSQNQLLIGCKNSVIPSDRYNLKIVNNAFNNRTGLTTVNVPGNVIEITDAFTGCVDLETAVISEGLTKLGFNAFKDCKNLKEITLPSSLTSIDYDVFNGDEQLSKIIFQGTKEQWNAVEKNKNWNRGMGSYKVICTDGETK